MVDLWKCAFWELLGMEQRTLTKYSPRSLPCSKKLAVPQATSLSSSDSFIRSFPRLHLRPGLPSLAYSGWKKFTPTVQFMTR